MSEPHAYAYASFSSTIDCLCGRRVHPLVDCDGLYESEGTMTCSNCGRTYRTIVHVEVFVSEPESRP